MDIRERIEELRLEPHPEGGYYRRLYSSDQWVRRVENPGEGDELRAGSSILYLLPADEVSELHRLQSDEVWHFYHGNPLCLHLFYENGEFEQVRLEEAEKRQFAVPGGTVFGATVEEGYALVGCTVFPEFRFEDFERPDSEQLREKFPEQARRIEQLTSER